MATGNANGVKFNFKATSNSGIAVCPDLADMRIEIAPEVLYLNAKNGVYTNIKSKNASGELIDVETSVEIIDESNNRELANQKKLIRIFKNNSYLNFVYDKEKQVFVSEPFKDFSNIYIKYVGNTNNEVGDGIDLKLDVTAGYEGDLNYLTSLNQTDKKTKITLNFETKQGVKSFDVYAALFKPGDGAGTVYNPIGGAGTEIVADNVYINRTDEIIVWDEDVIKEGYALSLLKDKSIKNKDDEFINEDIEFDLEIAYSNMSTNPLTLKYEDNSVIGNKYKIEKLSDIIGGVL